MRYSYKNALNLLAEYAYSEGFLEVILDHADISELHSNRAAPIYEPRRIKIEGKYNYEYKTYFMLHELGHHELRKDWKAFGKMFPYTVKAEEHASRGYSRNFRRRKEYFIAAFEEECIAWDAGLELAQRFKIKINTERWNKLRTKCLFSYMQYYSTLRN